MRFFSEKFCLQLLLLLATFTISLSCFATNIAVINIQSIIDNAIAMQFVKGSIDDLKVQINDEVSKSEQELKTVESHLLANKSKMSEDAFSKELQLFNKNISSAQQKINNKKLNLDRMYAKAMELMHSEIMKIVSEIALQRNIDLVLPVSHALYYKNSLDITQEISDRLNKNNQFQIKLDKRL